MGWEKIAIVVAALAGCDGRASNVQPDAAIDAGVCRGTNAVVQCPKGPCPTTWSTTKTDWCPTRLPDARFDSPPEVLLHPGCGGFDIAFIPQMASGGTTGIAYYVPGGDLVGFAVIGTENTGWSCVAGVPDTFNPASCGSAQVTFNCLQ